MMKSFYYYFLLLILSFTFVKCADEREKIPKAIDKAKNFLHQIQRKDGAICDTINPLFDTWETVLVAKVLAEWKSDSQDVVLEKAMAYLFLNENKNGLLCHNQKCKAAYCLETTSEYFLLLKHLQDTLTLKERISTLINLQKKEGNWEVGNPDVLEQKAFPSVTGFVLGILEEKDSVARKKAVSWLISQQNAEGHWGNTWEYYDCPAYPLWVNLRALSHFSHSSATIATQKARDYILKSQEKDGCWNFKGSSNPKKPSPELQTALMLSALTYTNVAFTDSAFTKGIDFLLAHQQANGSWDGGYFPINNARYVKKEYIFATTRAMSVLQDYIVHFDKLNKRL